jgi:stress response protein SCP2
MVEGSLPLMPSDESVRRTLDAMTKERDGAREIIKVELEKLKHEVQLLTRRHSC